MTNSRLSLQLSKDEIMYNSVSFNPILVGLFFLGRN